MSKRGFWEQKEILWNRWEVWERIIDEVWNYKKWTYK
jgi:hypothetical protein